MIYILEGPDGVGKSTLAAALAEKTKGHVLHCSWKKEWTMETYFKEILECARVLSEYQDVVIDRWAPSEQVYGDVFRGGPSFDVHRFIWEEPFVMVGGARFIYCRNDNAIENHLKNKQKRIEMFEDMAEIVKEFDKFVAETDYLKWVTYDYDKVNMKEFIDEQTSIKN